MPEDQKMFNPGTPEHRIIGKIVRFIQFDKEVHGKIEGILPNGDYTVELIEDAGILPKGTVISVVAEKILS